MWKKRRSSFHISHSEWWGRSWRTCWSQLQSLFQELTTWRLGGGLVFIQVPGGHMWLTGFFLWLFEGLLVFIVIGQRREDQKKTCGKCFLGQIWTQDSAWALQVTCWTLWAETAPPLCYFNEDCVDVLVVMIRPLGLSQVDKLVN